MISYFITVVRRGADPMTLTREAKSEGELHRSLVKEFGEGVSLSWSVHRDPRPVERHMTESDWEAEGRRIALDSMDLPDGAYCAMAEELGLDMY